MDKISILGAGSMGTALARLVGGNGYPVFLWTIEKETAESVNRRRENKKYLTGVKLPVSVRAETNLKTVLSGAGAVIWALPVQVSAKVAGEAGKYLRPQTVILSVSKGLNHKTGLTVSQTLKKVLPRNIHEKTAVLMGPLFASEISRGVPSVGLLAAKDEGVFSSWKKILENGSFFVRYSDDVLGAELGGALKNIYAILLGICDGLGYGWNTKSAALTASMRELAVIGHLLGAKKETLYGLAGLGDLMTTGFGEKSRNRRFGEKICQGKSAAKALDEIGQVVEGVKTAEIAAKLLKKSSGKTPLLRAVYGIVHRGRKPDRVFQGLLKEKI